MYATVPHPVWKRITANFRERQTEDPCTAPCCIPRIPLPETAQSTQRAIFAPWLHGIVNTTYRDPVYGPVLREIGDSPHKLEPWRPPLPREQDQAAYIGTPASLVNYTSLPGALPEIYFTGEGCGLYSCLRLRVFAHMTRKFWRGGGI